MHCSGDLNTKFRRDTIDTMDDIEDVMDGAPSVDPTMLNDLDDLDERRLTRVAKSATSQDDNFEPPQPRGPVRSRRPPVRQELTREPLHPLLRISRPLKHHET